MGRNSSYCYRRYFSYCYCSYCYYSYCYCSYCYCSSVSYTHLTLPTILLV